MSISFLFFFYRVKLLISWHHGCLVGGDTCIQWHAISFLAVTTSWEIVLNLSSGSGGRPNGLGSTEGRAYLVMQKMDYLLLVSMYVWGISTAYGKVFLGWPVGYSCRLKSDIGIHNFYYLTFIGSRLQIRSSQQGCQWHWLHGYWIWEWEGSHESCGISWSSLCSHWCCTWIIPVLSTWYVLLY